ncbi:MAG: hypothetical protein IJJ99_04240 [Oscillospiraceae bacterium]|nr:hypothetical protein [Oscillospiraceae bacterium]
MMENSNLAPNRLVLLVTVVNKGKGTFFADLLQTFGVNLQMSFVGTGTAHSSMQELLGLKDTRRSTIFSVIRADMADAALTALEDRFQTVNGGTGIAFTMPLSSVIGKLSYGFLSNELRLIGEEEA